QRFFTSAGFTNDGKPVDSLDQFPNASTHQCVLIVDDHALVRAGIRELIERIDGFAVVGEAGRGEEALRLIEKSTPDLVLLDITMPGMSGFEVLQEIGKRFSDIRVVILTM